MTDTPAPTTEAGRAHLSTFISNQHHDNVDAAYECKSGMDRCDICVQETDDILAIEAEAARQQVTDDMTTAYMTGFEKGREARSAAEALTLCPHCGLTLYRIGAIHIDAHRARLRSPENDR